MSIFTPITNDKLDVVLDSPSGYPIEKSRGDTREAMMAAVGESLRDFPDSFWIEPKDWAERAQQNNENKTWAMNHIDRYTHQDPTHECTTHSFTRLFEAARNKKRGIIFPNGPTKNYRYPESGEFDSVWFSCLSIYAEANPQIWGGAGIREVMEIACRRGVLPDLIQPRDYGFKHALHGTAGRGNNNQSHGDWVPLKRFPEGWQETSKLFMPDAVIFPNSFEEAVCIVLQGYGLGVGRNQHAVPWMFLNFEGNNLQAAGYADSYDRTLFDSLRLMKQAWRGSYAVISTTSPDDWETPAE